MPFCGGDICRRVPFRTRRQANRGKPDDGVERLKRKTGAQLAELGVHRAAPLPSTTNYSPALPLAQGIRFEIKAQS
jgi:hypothetical protein